MIIQLLYDSVRESDTPNKNPKKQQPKQLKHKLNVVYVEQKNRQCTQITPFNTRNTAFVFKGVFKCESFQFFFSEKNANARVIFIVFNFGVCTIHWYFTIVFGYVFVCVCAVQTLKFVFVYLLIRCTSPSSSSSSPSLSDALEPSNLPLICECERFQVFTTMSRLCVQFYCAVMKLHF